MFLAALTLSTQQMQQTRDRPGKCIVSRETFSQKFGFGCEMPLELLVAH